MAAEIDPLDEHVVQHDESAAAVTGRKEAQAQDSGRDGVVAVVLHHDLAEEATARWIEDRIPQMVHTGVEQCLRERRAVDVEQPDRVIPGGVVDRFLIGGQINPAGPPRSEWHAVAGHECPSGLNFRIVLVPSTVPT